MTRVQDTIALIAAAAGVLLLALIPMGTVTAQQQEQPQRTTTSVRAICKEDMAKFCADASGPQKVKACMQDNAKQLNPDCRSALQTAGMIAK